MAQQELAPKVHHVTITKGGALLLKNILPTMHWYKGVPMAEAVAASQVPANKLNISAPKTNVEEQDLWGVEPYSLDLREDEREGIKKCLKFYYDNAALELKPATAILFKEFGLMG